MKKILLSLAMIAMVSSAAVGATKAYYSDPEALNGNTFTAGKLDLALGQIINLPFNVPTAVPGQKGTGTVTLTNVTGSIPGMLNISLTNLVESENDMVEPELSAGDYMNGGDLGLFLQVAMFVDVNGNGIYDTGDIKLAYRQDGSLSGQVIPYSAQDYLSYGSLKNNSMITSWNDIMTMTDGQSVNVVIMWEFPATNQYYNQNIAMTDSLGFDAVFTLNQIP